MDNYKQMEETFNTMSDKELLEFLKDEQSNIDENLRYIAMAVAKKRGLLKFKNDQLDDISIIYDSMRMLSDEKIIKQFTNNELILTTHRIRYVTTKWRRIHFISIMLEELSTCSILYKSNILLLIIGIIIAGVLLISGLILSDKNFSFSSLIVIITFLVIYFSSKEKNVRFSSAGESIEVSVSSISIEMIQQFIDDVESAKNSRYLLMKM